MHTLESCRSLDLLCLKTLDACKLLVGKNERTDSCVRTYERTLVTLDTVLYVPYRNECLNTTLLESCGAVLPCTVNCVVLNEVRNLQEVACLTVDRTNELLNECRSIVSLSLFVSEVSPCRINSKLLVLTAAVDSCEVLVYNVLTLLRVRLNDECLHLLYCEIQRNNLCDTEECRLEDGVGTVAETNLLSNLCSVDIVNCDVVLSEDALYLVRDEVNEFLAVEDCVQEEVTVLAQTACHVVHVQVCLYVASHEVRSIYLVCAVDWAVAETQV